jgi:hypothetical protein
MIAAKRERIRRRIGHAPQQHLVVKGLREPALAMLGYFAQPWSSPKKSG